METKYRDHEEREKALVEQIRSLEASGEYVKAFAARYCLFMIDKHTLTKEEIERKILQLVLDVNRYIVTLFQKDRLEGILVFSEIEKTMKWKLQSVLYSNYSCIFKKRGNYRTAGIYAQRGLEAEKQLGMEEVETHLNLCAIMSCKRNHRVAAKHASRALLLAKLREKHSSTFLDIPGLKVSRMNYSMALVASLYSLGAQLEHFGRFDDALKYYKEALEHHDSAVTCPTKKELEVAMRDIGEKQSATCLRQVSRVVTPSNRGRPLQYRASTVGIGVRFKTPVAPKHPSRRSGPSMLHTGRVYSVDTSCVVKK